MVADTSEVMNKALDFAKDQLASKKVKKVKYNHPLFYSENTEKAFQLAVSFANRLNEHMKKVI